MTPQEAIRRIKNHNEIHSKKEEFAIHITEALNMSIAALEKQIPKKTIEKGINDKCLVCGRWVNTNHKYCPECGQALDWSGTK